MSVGIMKTHISSHVSLFTTVDGFREKLLITAHGGSMSRPQIGSGEGSFPGTGGWLTVPDWTTLHFYGPHKKTLEDPGRAPILNPVHHTDDSLNNDPKYQKLNAGQKEQLKGMNNVVIHLDDEDAKPGDKIRNYRLSHFEESDAILERQLETPECQFDLLQLRDRSVGSDDGATLKGNVGYTLKNVLEDLESFHPYKEIYCSFCRCTSFQIFLEKISFGKVSGPTHDAYDNPGSIKPSS